MNRSCSHINGSACSCQFGNYNRPGLFSLNELEVPNIKKVRYDVAVNS